MIYRFYIHAEDYAGDADGPYNMDLFVDAPDAATARKMWRAYYKDSGFAPDDKLKIYKLPPVTGSGALNWEGIEMKELAP